MTANTIIYEFDEFRVDTENKVLQKNGTTILLTPKVFETLLVLVENSGRLLEKDELMKTIWHDSFVEESNLTFNVKMLRKALGDNASNPTFIETVPRRGYRFIVKVKKTSKESEAEPAENLMPRSQKFSKISVALIVILIGLATTVFASWLWKTQNSESNAPILSKEFELNKISDTGKVYHSAISADGEFESYTNESNGKTGLWLRQLKTGLNTEIIAPSADNYYGLEFSKDGKIIYFTRTNASEPIGLYKISVFGGVPKKIIANTQGGLSVSPDDKKIAFIRYEKGVATINKLMIADVDGNNEQLIKETEVNQVFWVAEFSPDGKTIAAAFGNTNNGSQDMGLVEIDLENGQQRDITSTKFFVINSIAWLPNKTGLILSANEKISEPSKLWQVDYGNGNAEILSKDSMNYSDLSFNQNADKLVANIVAADFHLYISDTDKPNNTQELTQARDGFIFTENNRIVYASDTSGNEEIWIMNLDGSNQQQLTNNKDLDAYPFVGKDKRIYFTSNRSGKMQLWRMNFDGTEQTRLTKNNGGYPLFVSPDGNEVYFQNAIDAAILKLSVNSGEENMILEKKAQPFIAFSPDGTKLAVVAKNKETGNCRIDLMDLQTKNIEKTFAPLAKQQCPIHLQWLNGSKALTYVQNDSSGKTSFFQQNLNEPKPTLITDFGTEEIMDAKFSNDGKTFAFIRGNWKHDAVLFTGLR